MDHQGDINSMTTSCQNSIYGLGGATSYGYIVRRYCEMHTHIINAKIDIHMVELSIPDRDLSNYGSASSTIIGANSRTYHGLLVAALNPPVDRTVLLSSLDEEILVNGNIHRLAVHRYPDTVYPTGFEYLKKFALDPFPTAVYRIGDIVLTSPFINMRNFHYTTRSDDIDFVQDARESGTTLGRGPGKGDVLLSLTSNARSRYLPGGTWYYNFEYDSERVRGLAYQEDNYNPGYFEIELEKGTNHIFVAASTEELLHLNMDDIENLYEQELVRLRLLAGNSGLEDALALTYTGSGFFYCEACLDPLKIDHRRLPLVC